MCVKDEKDIATVSLEWLEI